MADEVLLAFSTFPDLDTARRIVRALVEARLVACGNIITEVESIYRWKGEIESGSETLVLFKVSTVRQSMFQEKLRSLHPYEVPEIIFIPVTAGLPDYLRWVNENCS